MNCEKDWMDIFTALLTPTIAILGIGIAGLQWRINKARLQHELFEKRWEIFDATSNYLGYIVTEAKYDKEEDYEFLKRTRGAFALYNKDIIEYLSEIRKNSIILNLHQQKNENEEEGNLLNWFYDQANNLEERFAEELRINKQSKIRVWISNLWGKLTKRPN